MKRVFFFITLCFFAFSCTNDEILKEETLSSDTSPSFTKTLIYQDNTYTVTINNDGSIDNTNLDDNIISAITSSNAVEISDQNAIYLFDQKAKMEIFIEQNISSIVSKESTDFSKAGAATSRAFQHSHYRGPSVDGIGNFAYPSLRPYGFNDHTSSVFITNYSSRGYIAQFFEHDNYGGRVYSIIVNPNSVEYRVNFALLGFNDKTSSITGRYL